MRKTLFAGLLLLLVVSLTAMSSCAKSAVTSATTTSAASVHPINQTTSSSTTDSLAGAQSADWSDIPVFPGSVRDTALEATLKTLAGYSTKNFRCYVIGTANGSKVGDYYNSELPKHGWSVGTYDVGGITAYKGTSFWEATAFLYIVVSPDTRDKSKSEILYSFGSIPDSNTTPSTPGNPLNVITTSSTAGALTVAQSKGWSNIPIYPGSVRSIDLEKAIGGAAATGGDAQPFRIYINDIANMNKVIDYYHSELPKHGWSIYYQAGTTTITVINGSNILVISVGPDVEDPSKCFIDFAMTASP